MGEEIDLHLALQKSGVAVPGCLSRIPDVTTATKEQGGKICCPIVFFVCSHKYYKIENYLFLNR
jgi:hypothetical protein